MNAETIAPIFFAVLIRNRPEIPDGSPASSAGLLEADMHIDRIIALAWIGLIAVLLAGAGALGAAIWYGVRLFM